MIEIEKYLLEKKEEFRVIRGEKPQFALKRTLCCGQLKKDKFYINADSGKWDCKLCGESGDYNSLRDYFLDNHVKIEGFEVKKEYYEREDFQEVSKEELRAMTIRLLSFKQSILDYVKSRGIEEETIKEFNIGVNDKDRLSIPIFRNGVVIDLISGFTPGQPQEMPKYLHATGADSLGLLNGSILEKKTKPKTVIITEGTFDCLTIWQNVSKNVVGTVGGAANINKSWVDNFKGVEVIYVIYDNDNAGRVGVEKLSELLGKYRTVNIQVPLDYNDVNEFFCKEKNAKEILLKLLEDNKPKRNDSVKHISEFSEELYKKIEEGELKGLSTGIKELDDIISGYKPGQTILLGALTSVGKCVCWDSEILNPITGAVVTIEDFVKRRNKYIYSWEYDRIVKSNVVDWIDSGKKEVFEVSTLYGTSCKVTEVHPFLCEDMKWRELKDLKVGDKIGIPRYYPSIFGTETIPDEHIKILAFIIADGYTTEHHGITWSKKDYSNISKLLKKYNYNFTTSHFKEIPKIIFRLTRDKLKLFLSTLFAGDGSICKHKDGRISISYCSSSKKMINDIRGLLLRFGVDTRLVKKHTNFDTISYELIASDVNTVKAFYKNIGINSIRKSKILEEIKTKEAKNYKYSNSALRFVEIVDIEKKGIQQVYDLSIEGTHNFIVNDMLVHNTTSGINFLLALSFLDTPTYFTSLEMTPTEIGQKILQMVGGIGLSEIYEKKDGLLVRVKNSIDKMGERPIYLYDGSGIISYSVVESGIRSAVRDYGVRVAFIDYLQYFELAGKNRAAEVGNLVNSIKGLAMELGITIYIITQLNRGGRSKQRTGLYIPSLPDLKESSTLEQSADIVMFLCRDSESVDKHEQMKTILKVAKNRGGKTGHISLNFEGETGIFSVESEKDYMAEALGKISELDGDSIFN